MTVLLTIFVGLPTFVLSCVTTKSFTTALKRLIAIAVVGCIIDLTLISLALFAA